MIFIHFKSGMESKSATPLTRMSYVRFMMVLFQGNNIPQAVPLIPALLKCIERAAAQPSQPQLVSEGLSAACCLLKLIAAQIEIDGIQNLWNVTLDMDKQLFFSEKYLSVASDDCEYLAICSISFVKI